MYSAQLAELKIPQTANANRWADASLRKKVIMKKDICKVCDREISFIENKWRHDDVVTDHWHPAAQQGVQSDVCPVCAGKRHIQTKSRGLVKCASCNGTGQRR
jgi:hypothetical protein